MIFKKQIAPKLIDVKKIWDQAPHNALTDLIRFNDRWLCCFREADKHVSGENGSIRIIASQNGSEWASIAYFTEIGVDLRDPKLSITSSGQLMLLFSGTVFDSRGQYKFLHTRAIFSNDGRTWTPFHIILDKHEWLWRVTWHRGAAYGASYSRSDPFDKLKEWNLKLYKSTDGFTYNLITQCDIQGFPNETTLRFLSDETMVALVRREKPFDKQCWLGKSSPPYEHWEWKALDYHIGGPNFIVLPDETMLVAGRISYETPYMQLNKTFLGTLDTNHMHPCIILPSGGDCSYPGMVYHEGQVWMSYYSSHEEKTAIYLARFSV